MSQFDFSRIYSRIGIGLEVAPRVSSVKPSTNLFVRDIPEKSFTDLKISEIKSFNKPFLFKKILGSGYVECQIHGIYFMPSNAPYDFLRLMFGNDFYSNPVHIISVDNSTNFLIGDIIFGKNSKARGEIVRIVNNTLWLFGVQGVFEDDEELYNAPDGTSYGSNTTSTNTIVENYYCHSLECVLYTVNKSNCIRISKQNNEAFISDYLIDFSKYIDKTNDKRNIIIAVDNNGLQLSGWVSDAIMCLDYDNGTSPFTKGRILKVDGDTVGRILAIDGDTTSGTLWVTCEKYKKVVSDNKILTDDLLGEAVSNMPDIPAYVYNAAIINPSKYNNSKNWVGDINSFETITSFEIRQKTFYQKSATIFWKDAESQTLVLRGCKVTGWRLIVDKETFAFDLEFLATSEELDKTDIPFPTKMVSTPYGAFLSQVEINNNKDGQANDILNLEIEANFDFSIDKSYTFDNFSPKDFYENEWEILGNMEVQWKNDQLAKDAWGSNSCPMPGDITTKKITCSLDSGEEVVSNFNNLFIFELIGSVFNKGLKRDQDGYTQEVTLEGVSFVDNSLWGPVRFLIFDGEPLHE